MYLVLCLEEKEETEFGQDILSSTRISNYASTKQVKRKLYDFLSPFLPYDT